MKIFKIATIFVVMAVLCIFLGYQTAVWSGISGIYECNDVACPFVVTFVTGPLLSIAYAFIAGGIFLLWRRTHR
ncbi:hypothetical protein FS827_08525 [Agrobacterium vitis]|uniref:hypothetical protein n=1 Tax=Allorhizobium ampelinum TaxID=3025782 RepID=UPI001F42FD38|nr:hypothetical protein [Allorhizobium ampelinum]MCF1461366.1 hypothetical protein [Allorhizobium ampelinum]